MQLCDVEERIKSASVLAEIISHKDGIQVIVDHERAWETFLLGLDYIYI